MDIEHTQELLDIETDLSDKNRIAIEIFLAAINDWPKPCNTFEDYELDLRYFIGAETTKDNLINAEKNINVVHSAWESESIAGVVQLFDFLGENLSLKEIINKLNQQLA